MGALVDDVNIRTLNLDFKWKTVAELYECLSGGELLELRLLDKK